MKFFATAALIVAVNAACLAEGDDGVCEPVENQCVKSEITEVKKSDSQYKKDLKKDGTLIVGTIKFECKAPADATALLETTGVADAKNKVVTTYTVIAPPEGAAKSNANAIKTCIVAAALGLISYM